MGSPPTPSKASWKPNDIFWNSYYYSDACYRPLCPAGSPFLQLSDAFQWGSARVARTNNYTEGTYSSAVGTPDVTTRMTATLYRGLLDPPANSSALLSNFCQTGNCTFPQSRGISYSSLAMCSKIEDISTQISGDGELILSFIDTSCP